MTFFNEDGSAYSSTEATIMAFMSEAVIRKRRKEILAHVLYAVFINQSKMKLSARKFYGVLKNNGYRLRPALGGDIYENLQFKNGERP